MNCSGPCDINTKTNAGVSNISSTVSPADITIQRPLLYLRGVYALVGFIILVENFFVLVIVFVTPSLRKRPRHFLILNIGVIDTTIGLYVFISNLVYYYYLETVTRNQCILEKIFGYSLFAVSLFLVVLICLERYHSTATSPTNIFRGNRKFYYVAVSWIVGFLSMSLIHTLVPLIRSKKLSGSCVSSDIYGENAIFVNICVASVIVPCCLLILIIYTLTARKLKVVMLTLNVTGNGTGNGTSSKRKTNANQLKKPVLNGVLHYRSDTVCQVSPKEDTLQYKNMPSRNNSTCNSYDQSGSFRLHNISVVFTQKQKSAEEKDTHVPPNLHKHSLNSSSTSQALCSEPSEHRCRSKQGPFCISKEMKLHHVTNLNRALYTTKIILIVLFIFFCPLVFVTVLSLFTDIPPTLEYIVKMCFLINSCFNPFIYVWLLKDFRRALKLFIQSYCPTCCASLLLRFLET